MLPLFESDEFEPPRVAMITLRVIIKPDGNPAWYEVTDRAPNGTLTFRRWSASLADWPNDLGYLSATEALRDRLDTVARETRML